MRPPPPLRPEQLSAYLLDVLGLLVRPSPELGQNVYFTVKCILKLSAPEFTGPLDLLRGSRLLGKLKFILNRLPAFVEAATKPHSIHKEGKYKLTL